MFIVGAGLGSTVHRQGWAVDLFSSVWDESQTVASFTHADMRAKFVSKELNVY